MAAFPDIKTPNSYSETPTKSQIKSEFENGDVISRPRYSRGRMTMTIGWDNLPNSDYTTLKEFFYDNQGLTFTWTHPITSEDYTVRFSDDDIGSWKFSKAGYMSGSISIEEA